MSWQQLELELPAGRLPEAEALLQLLGAQSLTLIGTGSEEILEPDPGSTPVWGLTRLRALFPADLDVARVSHLLSQTLGAEVSVDTRPLTEADWAESLATRPRELPVGRRLLIAGAEGAEAPETRTVVRLNRGLGFGTGDHPTTRLCLEWLDAHLAPGTTVIDYGCGSGVLAVAALRLGAARAWAVDIEPQAIEATAANAALNEVGERLWAGHPEALPAAGADVVLANILARPLIELAPRLAALTGSAGHLVLTGLLLEQHDRVRDVYAAHFASLERRELAGWVCLIASARHG